MRIHLCLVGLALVSISSCVAEVGESEYVVKIEHCIACEANSLEFVPRGIATLTANRANGFSVTHSWEPLSAADLRLLKETAKDSRKKLYRIRASSSLEQSGKDYVMSFTKICSLVKSDLSDIVTLSIDSSVHRLLSITVNPRASASCDDEAQELQLSTQTFNSTVIVVDAFEGPAPETQAYFQKIEKEKQERESGGEDNRSFIQKYWIYIVPIALFVMISGALNPEAQQQR